MGRGLAGEAFVVGGGADLGLDEADPVGLRLLVDADAEESAGVGGGDEFTPGGVGVVAGEGGGGEVALGAPTGPAGGEAVGAGARVGVGDVAAVGLEGLPEGGLGVVGPIPVGIVEGDA